MTRHHLSLLAISLLMGVSAMTQPAAAQASGQTGAPSTERIVSVAATGTVHAPPDSARITTGVVSEGATAREALDANSKAMRALIDGLKALGLDAKDIQTSQLGVEPRYEHYKDGRPPRINGYRVVNQVRILLRDIGKVGEVIDRSITLGANQLGGISFEVSNAEALKDEARRQAMANGLRRAQIYATAAGAEVGRVLSISETSRGLQPQPIGGGVRMAMAESAPVEPGQQALEVTVYVTWSLR